MYASRIGMCTALFLAIVVLVSIPAAAEGPLRGLVVDRGDNVLWLGFPAAAQKGMAFNVSLLPGNNVIARAEVVEATPDAPYVAKANFTMLDKQASIPVGAYVEAVDVAVACKDKAPRCEGINRPKEPNPLSFQAGVFFPSDDQLDEETDEAWPAFQLDYRISSAGAGDLILGLGYYRRHGTFTVGADAGRRDLQVIPVTIDAKLKFSQSPASGWYAKFGTGAYIVNDDRTVGAASEEISTTTIGWQVALGHETRKGRTVQLSYLDARQRDFKGITFTLGARF